ncbi:hypothetical protein UlMin_012989 [Ulmus minor]
MSGDVGSALKLRKKLKVAALRSGNFRDGNSKACRRLGEGEDGGKRKRNLKFDDKDQESERMYGGKRGFGHLNFDKTRKRVYADRRKGGEVVADSDLEGPKRKTLLRKRQNLVKDDVVRAKQSNVSSRTMWVSGKLEEATSNTKSSSREVKSSVTSGLVSDVTRVKRVGKKESVEDTGLLNKRTNSKFDTSNGLEVSKRRASAVSQLNSSKKKVQEKSLGEELEVQAEQPRRRKRIRLDPYDISNKRMDDGTFNDESTKEKKKDSEEKDEMSKNAQFRAIQPSPSILSYVEDNLLGRRRLIELQRAGYNTELSAPLDNIPSSTSAERERIEENIFRNKLTFFAAAKVASSFPPPELPEIAFAGRSNVGKSSLLNSLTRQWGVVRTSDKPGLTQTINFFNLGSKLHLVDLPGYGFAYAKEEVKDAWEELVKEYVSTRVGLKRVCLLIDTKWGMKPRDHELIDLMERAQTKYQIVLTKTDTVFPIDVARRAMQIEESLKAHKSLVQPVMMASSKSGAGIRSLRTVLAKIARFAKI